MDNSIKDIWYRFTNYKKLYWPLNAILFNLLRLLTIRDKELWVFGALGGNLYEDNSKFLFEYVNNKAKGIVRVVWLTRNEEEIKRIRGLGFEAYSFGSWRGIKLALKAGVAFYTHGLDDFGHFPLIGGATIYCLWHGFSFKRIYNSNYVGVKATLKKIADAIFNWVYRDYSMVTSEYTKAQFISEFGIKDANSIIVTGQPRNDALFKSIDKEDVLGADLVRRINGRKIILYMPTYRRSKKNIVEEMISRLIDNIELNNYLSDNNYLMLIKLHPLTPSFKISSNDNFILLSYSNLSQNQALLPLGDMLITDYSGVFVDFALLRRPIIFYSPQDEIFNKYAEKQENDFEYVSNMCKAENLQELVGLLKEPNVKMVDVINEYFSDPKLENTCFCENVYNAVASIENRNKEC